MLFLGSLFRQTHIHVVKANLIFYQDSHLCKFVTEFLCVLVLKIQDQRQNMFETVK